MRAVVNSSTLSTKRRLPFPTRHMSVNTSQSQKALDTGCVTRPTTSLYFADLADEPLADPLHPRQRKKSVSAGSVEQYSVHLTSSTRNSLQDGCPNRASYKARVREGAKDSFIWGWSWLGWCRGARVRAGFAGPQHESSASHRSKPLAREFASAIGHFKKCSSKKSPSTSRYARCLREKLKSW